MDHSDRLLWSCRDDRDDDNPRLVWADAVGGERGELVVLQCELARGGMAPERARVLRAREAELLAAHGRAWSNLEGLATRCVFRRGFVEAAEIKSVTDTTLFSLIGRAPLLDALSVEDEGDRFGALFAQAELSHIRALSLQTKGRNADDVVTRVLDSAHTSHLTGLALLARTVDREVELLFESTLLAQLEQLWIPHIYITRDLLADIGVRARRLRALRLFWTRESIVDAIPSGLREVELGLGLDEGWAELAASPAAPTLECIRVRQTSCEDVEHIAALPRLRALDLGDCQLGVIRSPPSHRKTNRAFADVRLPKLRELSYTRWSSGDEYDALVANLGSQLELLHLPSHFAEPKLVAAIAPRLAGTLSSVSSPKWSKALLLAECGPNEPWLQATIIDL